MRFIGETRFSLLKPESPNWLASNGSRFGSLEEYRDYLYSTKRLDVRSEIFLDVSLPQLQRASASVDYRHVVSYSETLPATYQLRLEEARRQFDFLVLDRHTGDTTESSSLEVAREIFGPDSPTGGAGTPFGWFRLDDDDLLSADYFEQMRPYVTAANVGMQVSLGSGYTALWKDGCFYDPRSAWSPLIAVGLLSICMFDGTGQVIRPVEAPHHESDRYNPVILDSRKAGYLWVRHLSQDTSLRCVEGGPDEALASIMKDLNRFPRVNSMGEVERLFPLSAERFSPAPSPGLALIAVGHPIPALDERGLRVETGATDRAIQVELTLECGADAVAGNALLGLDLVDSAGIPLGPDDMQDELRQLGLSFSQVPGIGHFRYLASRPGRSDYSVTLNLPDGVFCTSVLLRRWNNPALDIRVARLEIFGMQFRGAPKSKPVKVFIWGSCVSRDPFELDSDIEIVDYRARSSLGSAFAARPLDWENQIDLGSLTSPFQRRMATADVIKSLAVDLRSAEFDALILDFIDERMSTVDFCGSVVTDSPELAAAGLNVPATLKHEPWSENGWALRKAGIVSLLEIVDPSRIIVNRVYWATTDDAGDAFAQARWIAKNNAFLRELYEIIELIPGIRFIDYPDEMLVAGSEHHWGRQPYHYIAELNQYFLFEVEKMLAAD
ncbi:DUF6270 domain-containing protein [Arthrobacter sp. UYEF3]|uniref:DUF6270 domain-containing protein n=1 Tax=Arthrobacter sp. UYEF3 TaxID=1756365 RepID=UPI003392F3F9